MPEAAQKLSQLTVLWVTPDQHIEAWDLLERYDDQDFSFCDCTSFVLSRSEDVDFVFGFDAHFRIAGLDLRPGP